MVNRTTLDFDQARWDATLLRLGGDFLQSWQWGAFKARHGWSVQRIYAEGPDGEAMAQILFRRRGPFTLAYLPRGPIIRASTRTTLDLLDGIDRVCAKNRAIVLLVEPDQPLPPSWVGPSGGFVPSPTTVQTPRTVKVPLGDDATLLAQMRKDTRTNILHAQRRDVRLEQVVPTHVHMNVFYRLLEETAQRSEFGIHTQAYYEDFLSCFGEQAILLFSWSDTHVTGGLIATRFGLEGRSMYAGSATVTRGRGDAALVRFAAMQWARDQGCSDFDLGGIAPWPVAAGIGDSEVSGLRGVDQFKTGFGGTIVAYPASMERRYWPGLAWLMRRCTLRIGGNV